ncbi:protein anachronism isoform X2 [Drosophila subpulchrella]|uniref:protein anachronism isoform X2 n=1 Tax=Drosophila subpulchrella TaxID=1486046 RepID=UPI0018A12F09|nr:protein anachronism isoform X2 [Drosophila subpulchrella]
MASAVRGERCGRSRIRELILVLTLVTMSGNSRAIPLDPSFFIEGVQSEVVNPFNRTILNRFNLTEEQILSIQNRSNPNMRDSAGQTSNQQFLQQIATQRNSRLNDILKNVQKAISNEPNGSVSKEKAGFPICNAETTSPQEWPVGNNVTLTFASSVFTSNSDDRLSSAVLRLYKTNPGQNRDQSGGQVPAQPASTETSSSPANCAEQPPVGPQIRVTVSIVLQQRKKQRKKRTCNTAMLSSSSSGWVEIDVKCALAYWEQQQRQQLRPQPQLTSSVVGTLVIEVHDDEENPLKPGLYFEPPTCDQAEIAVPWRVYRTEPFKSHLASWPLPRKPRLDIMFNGSNYVKSICNTPKSRAYIESTTSNSPTIDNQLDESGEIECQHSGRTHLHHRRHHNHNHSHQQPESDSESAQAEAEIEAEELMSSASNSEQQMEPISNHHRHRTGHHHPHQLHQHHQHHHRHPKHHKIPTHKQE